MEWILIAGELAIILLLLYTYFKKANALKNSELEKSSLNKKIAILSIGNEWLKSTNKDHGSKIRSLEKQNADLKKSLSSTILKLEDAQKKFQTFSKMVNEMKNS